MKVEHVLLRSKVARRIFSLFVLCALLPLSILAFFSYRYVTRELQGQADQRLHEAAKSAGMTIVERMQFLDTQLEMAAAHIPKAGREGHGSLAEELCQRLRGFFKGLALRWEDGESLLLIGEIGKAPILEKDEAQHIASGKTLVFTRDTGEGHTKTFMARLMTGNEMVHGLLFGEINPEYLWGGDGFLLSMTELLVIDRSRNVLFSSFPHYDPSKELDEALKQSGVSRRFTWTYDGDRYIASLWTIFMAPQFHDNWTVVQSRLHTEIMAPLHNFKQIFIFSVILTFAVVLLLSHIQVRRNLTPLEFLMNATRRIAAKDFGHQVKIETNDEFEELGASFNEMAARLEIHLEIVTTLNRIGIALTAERDTERLTELILLGAKRITNADGCSLYTISDDKRLQLSLMKIDSLSLVRQGSDGIWIPLYDEGRPNERNVAAYCALNDTTINIPGKHTAEGFDLAGSLPIDLEEDYRVKSFLSIPMKNHEQEVIGVLQLINARDTRTLKTVPFSEEDKHLAEILAAQAGVHGKFVLPPFILPGFWVRGQNRGTRNYKKPVFMRSYEGVVVHCLHFA